ncbi:MAG: BPSS1780 family membrane protein [Wenzhouxiangellaceae bacterium]
MTHSPHIRKASFGDGAGWLIGGGELLGRGGSALMRVVLVLLVISLIQIVPLIGTLVLLLISPALTAGMLNVFRSVEQGVPPGAETVLAGLRDPGRRGPLLMLGAFFIIGVFAAIGGLSAWLAPQMDLQALAEFMNDPEALDNNPEQFLALFEGVNVFGGLLLAVVVLAAVLGGLYFAVPLVFFWNWPVFTALVWSLRALLINWLAFLGFGLVVIGVFLLAGITFAFISGIIALALGTAGAFIAQLLSMALSLFLQLLVAAAQWRSFIQVFPAGPDEQDGPGEGALEP